MDFKRTAYLSMLSFGLRFHRCLRDTGGGAAHCCENAPTWGALKGQWMVSDGSDVKFFFRRS